MKNWITRNRSTLLWILLGALATALLSFNYTTTSLKHFAIGYAWSWIIWMTQWFGNAFVGDEISKRVSWMEQPLWRAILGIIALIVYSSVAFIAVQAFMGVLILGYEFKQVMGWIDLKYPIGISAAIALIIHAVAFFSNWKESQLEAERLRTQMMTYQYESLRNQINPHFLFNSFNVLSELVYEDQSLAVKFIRQLSDIYRYVLDSKDKELVPLSEEIAFIEKFGFLLQTRFEDHLNIEIEFDAKDHEFVVPMSLQLLLENAVKHNEISKDFPLRVRIHRKNGFVEVRNNTKRKDVGGSSLKTGLLNIRKRYDYLSDKKIQIEEGPGHFSVSVPIIKGTLK